MYKKIGVVVAMNEEHKDILNVFGMQRGECCVGSFLIKEFCLEGKCIWLISSGIGNIKAAMATQLLIEKCHVEVIINFGLAGGLDESLRGQQELLVDKIVPYDFSFNVLDDRASGVLIGEKTPYMILDYSSFPFLNELNLTRAVCASADKFVNSRELKKELVSRFDAQICEMEAYGIVSACKMYAVPCIMIKAISDMADESASQSLKEVMSGVVDFYKRTLAIILEKL